MKKKITIWLILDLLLLVIACGELWILLGPNSKKDSNKKEEIVKEEQETSAVEETTGEEETEAPVPTEEPVLSKGECARKISALLEGAEGVWEVFISDKNEDTVLEKGAGDNIRAGDIEYFFLAHQIYDDLRIGGGDAAKEEVADALLENRNAEAYNNLYTLFNEANVLWEEETGRTKLNVQEETYPYTFWDEDGIGYSCARDSVNLLSHIAEKAAQGDAYAGKEKAFLEKHWDKGSISEALTEEGAEVLELASENEDRIEDFGYVTLEDGTTYEIGIMVKAVTDGEDTREKISEITRLAHQYYQGRKDTPEQEKTETPVETETRVEQGLVELKSSLTEQISSYEERVSIYVKDFHTDTFMEIIGGEQQKAASLIKLYVMASVYDQIQKGSLQETDEINTLLSQMITVSDNESTNELVRRLSPDGTDWEAGSHVTNAYITEHGYQDTSMGRDVQDYRETPPPGENYTSVTDCGKILEEIYEGTCVSPQASEKMMELLKGQQRRNKIPQGTGTALYIANKTGELDDAQNDVAIVQLDETRAYILCVMTDQVTNADGAISHVSEIADTVYRYFAGGSI